MDINTNYYNPKYDTSYDFPKEKTVDEIKEEFVNYIYDIVDYYDNQNIPSKDKLTGLAHSILSTIDGCNCDLPKFILAPDPHEYDMQYNQSEGRDWYPVNDINVKGNISGSLHDLFINLKR